MNKLRYSIRVTLHDEKPFFGLGVAELLLRIMDTSSLHKACEDMNMSYSKGWRIIKYAEQQLGFQLLLSKAGGAFGGGSEITEIGKKFAVSYMEFRKELYENGDILFKKHFSNYI